MSQRFHSALTVFVYLKGHPVLRYYFGIRDAHAAANDPNSSPRARVVPLPAARKPASLSRGARR